MTKTTREKLAARARSKKNQLAAVRTKPALIMKVHFCIGGCVSVHAGDTVELRADRFIVTRPTGTSTWYL